MNLNLEMLLNTEDYVIELDKFFLEKKEHFALNLYFYGAFNPTTLLIEDPSRDYFLIQFDKYAAFLGTLEEHAIPDEELLNGNPIVKVENSKLLQFAENHMQIREVNTYRGPISHYVIRTIEQEFHVLSHGEPFLIDMGRKDA